MNSYIITGGSGFVGNVLIKELLAQQNTHEIINIDLVKSTHDSPMIKNFVYDITNINDLHKLSSSLSGQYKIFHLAANIFNDMVPRKSKRKSFFFNTNVQGTQNLLDCIHPSCIESISFLSTDMVYGYPRNIPIEEINSLKPNGEYGDSKVEAEKIIINFCQNNNLHYTIFRPRLIIGPGRFGLLNKLFFLIKNNLPVPLIGDGSNRYQFISVFDCVNALLESITPKANSGIYNLGSLNPPTTYELLENLIHKSNSGSRLVKTHPLLIKKTLSLLDALNLSLMYPEQFLIADKDYVLSIEKLTKELGYEPKFNDLDMLLAAYEVYLNT